MGLFAGVRLTFLVGASIATVGCTGVIETPLFGSAGGGSGGPSHTGGGTGTGAGPTSGSGGGTAVACTPTLATGTTRVARLSHRQYANAVRDVLKLSQTPVLDFIADAPTNGYDNNGDALQVSDTLGQSYRRKAEGLASSLAADSAALQKLLPCAAQGDAACRQTFIAEFGARAFRRPLTAAEVSSYTALFGQATALYPEGTDFQKGVRVVVEAMLQSPKFLYRIEIDDTAAGNGQTVLSDHEIASRLSFALWNTVPDAALTTAAAAQALHTPEQIGAQVDRMLADPKAVDGVQDFHAQWMGVGSYDNLQPSPAVYPNFSSTLGPTLKEEVRLFAREVVLQQSGSYRDLMTAPYTFVNQGTAKLYGLTGNFTTAMTKAELDPTRRGGLLTQVGFLASHAHTNATAPILRGVFVLRRVLCNDVPPPGFQVDPVLPEGPTMRERVTRHTSPQKCASCHHTLINPTGFAFEGFNAAGEVQTVENGMPIDASGQLELASGQKLSFTDAPDFVAKVAQSPDAHACYALNLWRYAYGRTETPADSCAIETLAQAMAQGNTPIKSLIRDVATAPAFSHRQD